VKLSRLFCRFIRSGELLTRACKLFLWSYGWIGNGTERRILLRPRPRDPRPESCNFWSVAFPGHRKWNLTATFIALVLEESKVEKVDCFCFRHIPGLFYQSTFWGYLGSPKPTPVAPIDQCATPPLYSFLSVSRTCSSFFIQQRHMSKESVHVHAEGE
jgi:hypothetical protein